ncbi:TPA: hypothetical protein ACH3X2_009000 [Trebouxia sp. C0005]
MYSRNTTLELAEGTMAQGKPRSFLNLHDQDPDGSSALRKLVEGSEALQYIEYHCMVDKLDEEKEPHVEGSTFSFSGRSYYLHKLVKLPDLAQRLQAAIPACAASAVNLRKALVLISEIMDKVFLWREQVIHSFEELTTAISGDLWAMADELHDPAWTGRPQEQPEHVKPIIRFQEKVLDAFDDLFMDLERSVENMQRGYNNLFLRALYQMGEKAASLDPDADVCFKAMVAFCAVLPVAMKHQVALVLDECFEDSDPQTSTGTSDEDESPKEGKMPSQLVYSRQFVRHACMASLNHRSGNLEAVATVAGVNSADEASCSNSQASSENSAQYDDVSLESVD